MRPSRVLRKLRAGEIVHCFKLNLQDLRVVQIVSSFGFDCIWTCREHTPNDLSAIEAQIATAKAYDVDVMCRVPRGSYSDYLHPLELDAAGIMVPHIMNLADAQNVVRMCRFHPIGRRAADGGNADGMFCNVPFKEYVQQANRERFIMLQIEDPEALDHLDAICELDGFDILLFGPGDFSHAIGHPGEMDHPLIQKTRERIAQVARKHGKFAGAVGSPATRQGLIDMGYQFINVAADVTALSNHCREVATACGITVANSLPGYYGTKPA
ncbi:MAG: 4-hydroxy-2-oxovalerate aldolase [Verrucomicrobiae bacterium]|nr:4-hydroxy-2-oxovalerate aldolase [Verrucomicrobiae bacterium]